MNRIGIYVGRFQPFHRGHAEMLDSLSLTDFSNLLILVGNKINQDEYDEKNRWSFAERKLMIQNYLNLIDTRTKYQIEPLSDLGLENYNSPSWGAYVLGMAIKTMFSENEIASGILKHYEFLFICGKEDVKPYESFMESIKESGLNVGVIDQHRTDGISGTRVREILDNDSDNNSLSYFIEDVNMDIVLDKK